MYISGEELLQNAWTPVLVLSSVHTYLTLFNENSIKNVLIRAQNDSYFPQTSCLWILSPINYTINLHFVLSPFSSLYTDVTPAMGQVFSSFTLLPSLACHILCGESLWPFPSAQVENRISAPPSLCQPVQAFQQLSYRRHIFLLFFWVTHFMFLGLLNFRLGLSEILEKNLKECLQEILIVSPTYLTNTLLLRSSTRTLACVFKDRTNNVPWQSTDDTMKTCPERFLLQF